MEHRGLSNRRSFASSIAPVGQERESATEACARRSKDNSKRKFMNKRGRVLLVSILLTVFAGSNSFAQTQAELNRDACATYKNADAELNRTYKQVVDKYQRETVFVRKLKAAQRAWIVFRDADLESLYPDTPSAYGSVNPMCHCIALAELTTERTKSLKRWIDGVEEGDVCAGSVKIKK
jgi:uncharacterized protein YecT (DUF1311 family)